MTQQVTTQDLFEIIGRQTLELYLLKRQLEQLSAVIQQLQGEKGKAAQENGSGGVMPEGVVEY